MEYRKVALVFGNGHYERNQSLKNPVHDAEDMTNALKAIGFIVDTGINLSCNEMYSRIDNFVSNIRPLDMVVFHFSGHGTQWEDQNFLIPSDDGNLRAENIQRYAVNAQEVLDKIGKRDPFVSIIFLDCCRNYCLRHEGLRGDEEPRGLKPMSMRTRGGSVIGLACDAGKTASDGVGRNGLYTKHLLMHITKPDQEIQDLLVDVTDGVEEESKGNQRPWQNISLRRRNIFFSSKNGAGPLLESKATQRDTLRSGQSLKQNERITSQNGAYHLDMQEDGNLVLYVSDPNAPSNVLWSSATFSDGPNRLEVQSDGNLVIYDGSDQAIWASDSVTTGAENGCLILQNDGNLVFYGDSHEAVWATDTY